MYIYIYAYRYGCENLCYLGDLRASSLSFTAVLIMCCKRLLMKLLFPPVSLVRFKFSVQLTGFLLMKQAGAKIQIA